MSYIPIPQGFESFILMAPSPVELEMQKINSTLQPSASIQDKALSILYHENRELKCSNAAQHRILRGFAIPAAKDIIRNLIDTFKENEQYREILQSELKQFCKINVNDFLKSLEVELKSHQENPDCITVFTKDEDPDLDFRPALQNYIIKTLGVPDGADNLTALECLKTALGYTVAGAKFAVETLWAFTRLSFFCVEIGVGALILYKSPLVPFAFLLVKAYLKV